MIGQERVIHPALHLVRGRLTDDFLKTGTTRGENLSSSSPSLSYHAFWKKDNKHRQRYNHALPRPQTERGMARHREESALRMFDTLGLKQRADILI